MKNDPFEQDSIFPKVAGITTIGAAGAGIYKYATDENFRDLTKSLFNKYVSKVEREIKTVIQASIDRSYEAIKRGEAKATVVNPILRKTRLENYAIKDAKKYSFSKLTSLGKKMSMEGSKNITDITGSSIADAIKEKFLSRLEVSKDAVIRQGMDGTNLVLDVLTKSGEERFTLPMFEKQGKYWVNKSSKSTSIGKLINIPTRTETGDIVSRIVDPNTALLMNLSDTRRLDYNIISSRGGKDAERAGRDLLNRAADELPLEYKKHHYELKRMLNYFKQTVSEPISGLDIEREAALKGKEILLDNIAAHDLGNVSLIGSNVGVSEGRTVSKEGLLGLAEHYIDKKGKKLFGRYNTSTGQLETVTNGLSDELKIWLGQIQSHISSNLSQGQVAEGTASYFEGFADMTAAESLKSIKGFEFATNPNNVPFTKTEKEAFIHADLRTTPAYELPRLPLEEQAVLEDISTKGMINLPAKLSPYHSEAIQLSDKIKDLRIVKPTSIPLDELITQGEYQTELSSLMRAIEDTPNYVPDEGASVFVKKGEVIGRRRKTQNLSTKEEYDLAKFGEEYEVVKASTDLRIEAEHINKMLERNRDRIEGEPFLLFANAEDRQIKGGSPYGSTRGSIAPLSANYNHPYNLRAGEKFADIISRADKDYLAVLPEAEMSFDLFKNAIPSFLDKQNVYSKARGEYAPLLRSIALGNLTMSKAEMHASGEVKDLLLKHTNIADLYEKNEGIQLDELRDMESLNITKAQREFGGLTFKRSEDVGESILATQRLAAITQMAHEDAVSSERKAGDYYMLPDISNEEAEDFLTRRFRAMKATSDFTPSDIRGKALEDLPEAIKKDIAEGKYGYQDVMNNELNLFGPYAPHEAVTSTLGKGEGIFTIKGMDLSYMYDMPAALEEMAISSQVKSTKLTQETEFMMKSLSDSFSKADIESFEKSIGSKLEVLSEDTLREKLGPYLSSTSEASSAIKIPEIFFESLFGKDNPNGVLIKTLNRQGENSHMYFPSNDWWNGMMALSDGSHVPAKDDAYAMVRALSSAAESDGVVKGRMLEELTEQVGNSYQSNLKASSMQIEGRAYDKLIDDTFLTDTHKNLSRMKSEGAKELDYILGNVQLQSAKEYKSIIARKIEDAITVGKTKNLNMLDSLDLLYGQDNIISEHIRRTETSHLDPLEIANNISKESSASWNEIKDAVSGTSNITKERASEITNLIFEKASTGVTTRYPIIYPGSVARSLVFASDELDERSIAEGHVLKTIANADTDGDARHVLNSITAHSNKEAREHVLRENRLAYEFMTQVSDNKIIKNMLGKSELGAMNESMSQSYNKFVAALELEGVQAAKITKGITGITQARAWAQQGYYHDMLARNKELSEEAALRGRTFIDTIISKSGPQNVISAKLAKVMEDKETAEAISSLATVFDNIESVSADSINKSIQATGEVHTLVEQAIGDLRRPSNAGKLRKLNEDGLIDDAISLHDMQWSWRKLEDQKRIESIYNRGWLNKEGETLQEFSSRLRKAQEGIYFFTDDVLLKEAGLVHHEHYMDFLQEPLRKQSRMSDSIVSARRAARSMLENNSPKGEEIFEETIDRIANRTVSQSNRRKALGLDVLKAEEQRSIATMQKRTFPMVDKAIETVYKHMTPRNIAIGTGIALAGFAAINLLGGDGAPEELNDLPSYNNPALSNTRYNNINQRTVMPDTHNTNIATGLLTSQGADRGFLMNHINSIVGSRGYNSSTIISDGSSPYKQDLYAYGA